MSILLKDIHTYIHTYIHIHIHIHIHINTYIYIYYNKKTITSNILNIFCFSNFIFYILVDSYFNKVICPLKRMTLHISMLYNGPKLHGWISIWKLIKL